MTEPEIDLLSKQATRRNFDHPWKRGFPNHKQLKAALVASGQLKDEDDQPTADASDSKAFPRRMSAMRG